MFWGHNNHAQKHIRILTHSGVWHADEVLAVAMIKLSFKGHYIHVDRLDEPPEYLKEYTFVLDIGRICDFTWQFDHHHDASLPATCELVRQYLAQEYPRSSLWRSELLEAFSRRVSDIDCNGPGKMEEQPTEFSGMVRRAGSFDSAVDLAETILSQMALDIITKEQAFNRAIANSVAIDNILCAEEPVPQWREKTKFDFVVFPNQRGAGYTAVTRDSDTMPLPEEESTFIHNGRFLAVYPDHDTAVWACKHASILK